MILHNKIRLSYLNHFKRNDQRNRNHSIKKNKIRKEHQSSLNNIFKSILFKIKKRKPITICPHPTKLTRTHNKGTQ